MQVIFILENQPIQRFWRQIKSDLDQAYQWATIDGYLSIPDNKGRATKPSIDALLADIALWEFDYEGAIEHCNNIIGFNKYKIVPGENWFTIFYPGNTLEGILEFQLDGNSTSNQRNHTYDITNSNAYNYDSE